GGAGGVREVDRRRRGGAAVGQPQRAPAARVDQRGEDRDRGPGVDVVADRRVLVGRDVGPREQVQLQVGYVGRQRRTHEGDRLEDRVREERPPGAGDLPWHAAGGEQRRAAPLPRGRVGGSRLGPV